MAKANRDFFKQKKHWSEVKDELLGCYLPQYFQKVLCTGKPILYVDCFAGMGKFDDGKPGSPAIALQIRKDCLEKTKREDGRIETCFIELNHADDLRTNIKSHINTDNSPEIISGRYEDHIERVLSDKQKYNVFLYIDPYGIKALDSNLFAKFKTFGLHSLEILINFNSFGFLRDACRVMSVNAQNDVALANLDDLDEYEPTRFDASDESDALLTRIAGGDYWKSIVKDFHDKKIYGYTAERKLSTEYKQRLRKWFNYVLDMPIRLKSGHLPKYRLIHASDHEDGCYLMAENIQNRKDELFLYVQQSGQPSLFGSDTAFTSTIENDLMTDDEVCTLLWEFIQKLPDCEIRIKKLIATFFNTCGLLCDFKMIQNLLDRLQYNNKIEIIRNPQTKLDGKPRVFWDEKKGKTITIRRLET